MSGCQRVKKIQFYPVITGISGMVWLILFQNQLVQGAFLHLPRGYVGVLKKMFDLPLGRGSY